MLVSQVRSTWSDLQWQLTCINRRSVKLLVWECQTPDPWLPKRFWWCHWSSLELQWGDGQEESQSPPEKTHHTVGISDPDISCIKPQHHTPFLNPNPFNRWCGIKNMAPVRVNQESWMVFFDNGCQVNTVTSGFIEAHSLNIGLMSNLFKDKMSVLGLGRMCTHPFGYIILRVQVDGVEGYDEDQIALLIPDLSEFASRVPVILGILDNWKGHQCNEEKWTQCASYPLGKCQSGIPSSRL